MYLLSTFIEDNKLTIVFVSTKHLVEFLQEVLKVAGIPASSIYGNMDQTARNQNLQNFRKGRPSVLLVTDVAARGIGIFLSFPHLPFSLSILLVSPPASSLLPLPFFPPLHFNFVLPPLLNQYHCTVIVQIDSTS